MAATMLIEIAEATQIQPVLEALLGIDTRDYARLEVGPSVIVGTFEAGHSDVERGKISAVHFVGFPLSLDAPRTLRAARGDSRGGPTRMSTPAWSSRRRPRGLAAHLA
jgi:Protein of unknown function (DUF3501)